jgi:hypothetical protein
MLCRVTRLFQLPALAVHDDGVLANLDAVAADGDHPLDVVGLGPERIPEHDDVTAGDGAPPLVDEDMVADQQRRHHRADGDLEGLEQLGAHGQGDAPGENEQRDQEDDGMPEGRRGAAPGHGRVHHRRETAHYEDAQGRQHQPRSSPQRRGIHDDASDRSDRRPHQEPARPAEDEQTGTQGGLQGGDQSS